MPKLYVANCSKQRLDFQYRVIEDGRPIPYQNVILPGTQQQIWKDDSSAILKGIVDQHAHYGLISASEVDRTKEFVGYCYSFDKAVPLDKFFDADEHNQDVLTKRGAEIRKKNAAAMFAAAASGDTEQPITSLAVEITEEKKSRLDPQGMAEVIEVSFDGKPRRARQ